MKQNFIEEKEYKLREISHNSSELRGFKSNIKTDISKEQWEFYERVVGHIWMKGMFNYDSDITLCS